MNLRRHILLLVASLGGIPAVHAQVPAGGEVRVNTYTTGIQALSTIAAAPNGDYVVAWESFYTDQDGDLSGIFAQRYDSSGSPRGSEFLVNTHTWDDQLDPDIAADAIGNFVIIWESSWQDGDNSGIFGQRYDVSGARRGAEFRVHTDTAGYQVNPSVAADPAGNFVVVWDRGDPQNWHGMFAQRYDASGAPTGSEFRVNSTPERAWRPSVSSDAAGNFVIAWEAWIGGSNIFARRFDSNGVPRGPEFQVNTSTAGWNVTASVAVEPSGAFVIAWVEEPRPSRADRVLVRRYDASGNPLGEELQANIYTPNWKSSPTVTSSATADFVVAWTAGEGQDGSYAGIFARRFNVSGGPRGLEFQVNTQTLGSQQWLALASDPVGNLVVTWSDQQGTGWAHDIKAQRLGGILPAAAAVDTAASAGSDGNRVLEPGESVDVRPSWRNINGAAQTFDGAGLGFTGPVASGVSYELLDGAGTYGAVANGTTAQCSDCYRVGVTFGGTRPSVHWDATFTERLTPDALGQTMPWSLHVGQSFADVPKTSLFYQDVETLLHWGITAGCTANAYCPGSPVTRDQMAAFVLPAKEGAGYRPEPCSPPNLFPDVPETSLFCDVIEELARRGVVGGCGGGNYCPAAAVTREQMPVFVLRLLDPALDPPACTTPIFADVSASSPFCRWIEELARRGVVAGCGGGNYCPATPVTRDQMAAFLTGTYGLTLYGP